jgi:hypothetical protein
MPHASTYLASPQAREDLRALNARFIENFVTNDVTAHEALLHPRFINVNSGGARISRDEYLKGWATGFHPEIMVYWDTRDELITLIGNVGLVRATNKYVARHSTHDDIGMATYTDTYLYERGEWKCIQAQITNVTTANEPPESTIISVYINGIRQPVPEPERYGTLPRIPTDGGQSVSDGDASHRS